MGDAPIAWPIALDRAMPALVELASRLPGTESADSYTCNLTFWTKSGAETWHCRVSALEQGGGPGDHAGVQLLVVLLADAHATSRLAIPAPRDAATQGAPGEQQSSVAVPPSDVAAMQQIPRQIRQAPQEEPGPPDADAVPVKPAPLPPEQQAPGVAARLAHELRTPLSAILSLADVMAEGRFGAMPNDRYREYIVNIRTAARHLVDVVDSMLATESLETGQQKSTFSNVDINAAAHEIIVTFEPLAAKIGATVEPALDPSLPQVVADRQAIKQILINLLTNAIRHAGQSASGTRALRIVVTTGYQQGGEAWIDVTDDGPGIAPDVIARVAVAPAPQMMSSGQSGGLGLPLSRALAETSGARLEINRVHPHGTQVRLTFSASRVVPV